jgi:hypothetical protein
VVFTVILWVVPTTTAAAETPVTPLFHNVPLPSMVPELPLVLSVRVNSAANGTVVPEAAAVGVIIPTTASPVVPPFPILTLKFEALATVLVQVPCNIIL